MKNYIFLMLGMLCAISATAQTSVLATLSHDGTVTSFQGINALQMAYKAATDGDVITLSSGEFNAVNINKNLTIRGAGHDINIEEVRLPSYVIGNFDIGSTDKAVNVSIESIYNNGKIYYYNASTIQFIKCRLYEIKYSASTTNVSMTIIQSKIMDNITCYCYNDNIHCINSFIGATYFKSNSVGTFHYQFDNCIVFGLTLNSVYNNCIITSNAAISSSSNAINCIAVGESHNDTFNNIKNTTNTLLSGYDMFNTFKGEVDDETDFSLTAEAKAKYLGTDGTEVGIYGGALPYETTPNNPQITKFKVASKSTADGKLSVDISVAVPE